MPALSRLLPQRRLPALFWRWVLGCLLLALQAGGESWAATDQMVLRDDQPSVDVWPAVSVLADPSRLQSVQDAMARAQDFSAPPRTSGTLGMRSEAMWLRVPLAVSSTSDGVWISDIDYPLLNRIEVYLTTNGHVSQQATLGSLQPFSQRPLRSRTHALALALQPGHHYDLLLRVETRGAMVLPITLNQPTAWHSASMNEQMLQGMLMGLALCLLIYSLAQWMNLREVLGGSGIDHRIRNRPG